MRGVLLVYMLGSQRLPEFLCLLFCSLFVGKCWPERSVAFLRWGSVASSVFVTLLRGRVHLILANPSWRQLQERAEKIPGDKKHVEGMLSQSHCVAQFKTVQKRPSKRKAANTENVQNGAVSRPGRVAFYLNEKERTHARTANLCPLSYLWCPCRGTLRAAFRSFALTTTRRPEVCRCRGHREGMNVRPGRSFRVISQIGLLILCLGVAGRTFQL
jgi:hypothetical protein